VNQPAALDTLDGYCLAEEVIHALACGALEEKQRSKALEHLDECDVCQALLADEVRDLPASGSADDPGLPTLIQLGALVAGRYRIQHFVARGGMGEVYEAWDELLAERVALKTINPLVASADQVRASARFRQEVQLSRRVADAHVCRIYEFGQHLVRGFGAVSYLTMEFIEGQTLGARLRQGPPLALNEVVELSRQMLRGLGAAHAVGVLHRDFKSDNVLLRAAASGGLHAVIMDFGLARVLGDQAHRFTERHELVGSAAYMAPEQLEEGAELSEATDVYAFGVVLFEMLTGRLPFEGTAPVAVALRRLSHPAPPPSIHVPELSSGWDQLVLRCLDRSTSRRFASTGEVAAALEALVNESPRHARRRQEKRRSVAIGVGAGALLLGALTLSASRGRSSEALAPEPPPSVTLALEPRNLQPQDPAASAPAAAPSAAPVPAAGAAVPVEAASLGAAPTSSELAALPPPEPANAETLGASRASAIEPARAAEPSDDTLAGVASAPVVAPPIASPAPPARARRETRPRPDAHRGAAASSSSAAAAAQPASSASTAAHVTAGGTATAAPPADVRDIFFLEAPSERPAQNAER
jgi:serine/threonine protein kinase